MRIYEVSRNEERKEYWSGDEVKGLELKDKKESEYCLPDALATRASRFPNRELHGCWKLSLKDAIDDKGCSRKSTYFPEN